MTGRHHVPTMAGLAAGGLLLAAAIWLLAATSQAAPRFYPDDPLWHVEDTQDASGMEEREIGLLYDLLENTFTRPGDPTAGPALNINTVDEVPDSNWFTNRIGRRSMTPAEVARGPNTSDGPAPGTWTLVRGKTSGVTPGMRIVDPAGDLYFIKFDPPCCGEMASGAEVVVTKLFHALGYSVPENHIAYLRPEQLEIGEGALKTYPDGRKRAFNRNDLEELFRKAALEPDGSYRVLASKALPGKPVGPFRYYGTRPDDPNDIIPHEHRRELRALRVFAAWVQHVDSKSINSLDILVPADGRQVVRHCLIDFGSTLGSAATGPRPNWEGHEYLYDKRSALLGIVSLGLRVPAWAWLEPGYVPAVGRFSSERFDPQAWRPRYSNPAYLRARPDDLFWGARRVMAFSDAMLRAAVATGRYSDPEAAERIATTLIERRDQIGRAWLPVVNPLVDFGLDSNGRLSFENAAVAAGVAGPPGRYHARWHVFDNQTWELSPLGAETRSAEPPIQGPDSLPATPGVYVRVAVWASDSPHASWAQPLHVYFRRQQDGWKLVGLDRMPAAAADHAQAATPPSTD